MRISTWCAMAVAAGLAAPCAGQTDVAGKTAVNVGNNVPGISFSGTNKTKRKIHDFHFLIGDAGNVFLSTIVVGSSQAGGAGDWDLDDDEDGESNEANHTRETDDQDGSPGRSSRVDSKGAGNEGAPQNAAGAGIADDAGF